MLFIECLHVVEAIVSRTEQLLKRLRSNSAALLRWQRVSLYEVWLVSRSNIDRIADAVWPSVIDRKTMGYKKEELRRQTYFVTGQGKVCPKA